LRASADRADVVRRPERLEPEPVSLGQRPDLDLHPLPYLRIADGFDPQNPENARSAHLFLRLAFLTRGRFLGSGMRLDQVLLSNLTSNPRSA